MQPTAAAAPVQRIVCAACPVWFPCTQFSARTDHRARWATPGTYVAPRGALLQISLVSSMSLRTCCAHYPSRSPRQLRLSMPRNDGLRQTRGGSTSTSNLSGPVRASLALRSVRSPTQLELGPCPWSFIAKVAPYDVQVATKMHRQLLGPDLRRLFTDSFHVTHVFKFDLPLRGLGVRGKDEGSSKRPPELGPLAGRKPLSCQTPRRHHAPEAHQETIGQCAPTRAEATELTTRSRRQSPPPTPIAPPQPDHASGHRARDCPAIA
jgi:hypothetical protein